MRYVGGKSRIAKNVSELINLYSKNSRFISLFCGTCSIESKVISKSKVLNDLHEYLVACLAAAQHGYDFPNIVTKKTYDYVKNNKDEDKALTGFIGFGCSFGGKWFGGYAKDRIGTNCAQQSKRSLLTSIKPLQKNCKFLNLDYRMVQVSLGDVVYCDPPYINTSGYSNSAFFSHEEFWNYMRTVSKTNLVFISELTAPTDFVAVGCEKVSRTLDSNKKNSFKSLEKVYIHHENVSKYNFQIISNCEIIS